MDAALLISSMKTKSTIILALVALLLGGAVWLLLKRVPTTRKAELRGQYVLEIDRDKIDRIQMRYEERDVQLAKSGTTWKLVAPLQADADSIEVLRLLDEVGFLKKEQMISGERLKETPDYLKQFGLDAPIATLTVSEGKVETVVHFGKETPVPGRFYAQLKGTDDVIIVSDTLIQSMNKPADDFRDRRLVNIAPNEIEKIALASGEAKLELTRDGESWRMVVPYPARADASAAMDLISNLATARAAEFPVISDEAAGLAKPRLEITLASATSSEPVTLAFGGDGPGLKPDTDADPQEPSGGPTVYARVGADGPIVAVPQMVFQAATPDVNIFRSRSVIPVFLAESVDRVRFTPADGDGFTLVRDGKGWLLDAEKKTPANSGEVIRLLEALSTLEAVDFVANTAENPAQYGLDTPFMVIELLSHSSEPTAEAAAGEHPLAVLEFSKETDGLHFARLRGEPFVIAVSEPAFAKVNPGAERLQELQISRFDPIDLVRFERSLDGVVVQCERDGDGWKMKGATGVLDNDAANALVNALANLKSARWIGALPEEGLPGVRCVITFTSKDDQERVLNLAAPDTNGMIPGAALDKPGVFLLSAPEAAPLLAPLVWDKTEENATNVRSNLGE